jgi:hypothetical protein
MALIRCTCIYRATSDEEHARTGSPVEVVCPDPHCPASAVHERVTTDRGAAPAGR